MTLPVLLPARLVAEPIRGDLSAKYVLLSGPRQVGKTTLARSLHPKLEYLNFDVDEHRSAILRKSWDRRAPLLVLDELHKLRNWKGWLKGIFDGEGLRPPVLVTGSARLDVARRMGDSLAGRFFQYRLHPYDLKELSGHLAPQEAYEALLRFSGFPEPLARGSAAFYGKWRTSHLDIILRQDLLSLEAVRDIAGLEMLTLLLAERVGSTVSFASLGRDLERDPKTVKHWLSILESLFIIFKVTPYHRNVARSVLKEPKYYFFDLARVRGDEGAKLENLVALALRKYADEQLDVEGRATSLHFLRLKSGEEVDFLLLRERGTPTLLEVKLSDADPSAALGRFEKYFPKASRIQLVKNLRREATYPGGVEVRSAVPWLVAMPL